MEPIASSLRCAAASGNGSCLAFGFQLADGKEVVSYELTHATPCRATTGIVCADKQNTFSLGRSLYRLWLKTPGIRTDQQVRENDTLEIGVKGGWKMRYLVHGEIVDPGYPVPPQQFAEYVESRVIPTLERL